MRRFLEGKNWDAISADDLRAYLGDEQAILAFLTPDGFRYYLPAFLSIALCALDDRPDLAGSAIFYLTPSKRDDDAKRDLGRYAKLTTAQKDAIRTWLIYIDSHKNQYSRIRYEPTKR